MTITLPALLMQKISHHLRESGDLEAFELWCNALESNYREAVQRERDMETMPSYRRIQAG